KYFPLPPGKATISGHSVSGGALLSYPGGPGTWQLLGDHAAGEPWMNRAAFSVDQQNFGLVTPATVAVTVEADGSGKFHFDQLQGRPGTSETGTITWTCAETA
ncbi:MAG: hypothetical protein QOE92_281, partial [Chloroflexota bacterium]|nr:hypothetical protein [Chloroflexota bacterium]